MKAIRVTVKVCINDDADAYETIEDCDYSFSGEGIVCTEIVEITDENDTTIFY